MSALDEAVREFLVESHENLGRLDNELVALEKDASALPSIFRAVHTLKGSAGFLGFPKLEALAHVGEGVLGRLRDGKLSVTPQAVSALLAMLDAFREILAAVESTGQDGERDYADLIETLTAVRDGRPSEPASAPAATAHATPTDSPAHASPRMKRPAGSDTEFLRPSDRPPLPSDVEAESPRRSGDAESRAGSAGAARPASAPPGATPPRAQTPPPTASFHDMPVGADSVISRTPSSSVILSPQATALESREEKGVGRDPASPFATSSVADSRVRIDIKVLDRLMNLVSELVLARNQILQNISEESEAAFVAASRHLNQITTELQEEVMRTRMQPISVAWNALPRVVRDLAVACGKQVRLEVEGNETELDKTIIEAIKDPITHMVRNAVDHGIEFPGTRMAMGKPPEGRLWLRAYHESGQVNIEIADDGAGIDPQRIARKAIERGLVTAEQVASMGEQTLLNLIFLPGFSTAEKVTNLSGRGVGMDVVKNNIERIGGAVDIHSQLGVGTTIKVRIPLTLAIVKAMIVTSGGERYAIPQTSLVELLRIEGDKAGQAIEYVHDAPVFRFREKLLPIIYLDQLLSTGEGRPKVKPSRSNGQQALHIAVLQVEDRQFGLVVDWINDTQEIVVKPITRLLRDIGCFAGVTIMGNGRVALILDVLGLAELAGVLAKVRAASVSDSGEGSAEPAAAPREAVVLVRTGDLSRVAIPLASVARFEQVPRSSIERVGEQSVMQYRGQILPLIDVAAVMNGREHAAGGGARRASAASKDVAADGAGTGRAADRVHVVVCSERGQNVGLIVDRILDVAEESATVRGPAAHPHVQFTAVVDQQVTEVLDVSRFLRADGHEQPLAAVSG